MEFPFSIIVNSETETAKVVKLFFNEVNPGNVIALNGNLGSGKTFFIKKFCQMLGINDADSPTFSIINEYAGDVPVYHFDFYRINRLEELYDIGIDEYIYNSEAIKFIEWAELMPEVLPSKHFEIKLEFINNSSRKISIMKHD
ncbi:MAG: tRNA (adenosine(37)-N6)-threonylcarbamoyltransferase complex ATPase subunit type 1 TsaE [Ignavibacteriae bacterium]|nr:tRNA (adenosine(37)-N6)-threonylcarbamoyltransferase complex ATPase subunit type 1 TsaE [Ignavibacteriota bacterium]NOG99606.1 tRNA (adenosine(37)-N6)-threonylcarbamoyltransferase complex ATPase subunit type 1 TsaE [Ignavibacteriota bacterium]